MTGNGVAVMNTLFDLSSLVVAFVGAVVLLAIANLFTRGRVR